jgi:hypothetical protein
LSRPAPLPVQTKPAVQLPVAENVQPSKIGVLMRVAASWTDMSPKPLANAGSLCWGMA